MNEIDKLKLEHARYAEALASIGLADSIVFARKHALEALVPPPPLPPVTLQGILDALKNRNKKSSLGLHNITIFSDGSGHVSYGDGTGYLFHFETLDQALERLKQ